MWISTVDKGARVAHVYPQDEEALHNIDFDEPWKLCACDPKRKEENDFEIITHNSFDGRELFEPDYQPIDENAAH